MAEKSSELEQVQAGSLAAMPAPTAQQLQQARAAVLDAELPPQMEDPASIARAIQERIFAGTLDDSMQALESLPAWGDEYLGQKVIVGAFKLLRSSFDIQEGPNKGKRGVYAVVDLMTADGELVLVQTGGANVLAQLVKAWEEGRYPFPAVLEASDTGTPGRQTYWLRTPEAAR